jgi:hypothetical protein
MNSMRQITSFAVVLLSSLWSVTSAAETPERRDAFRPLLLTPPPAPPILPETNRFRLRLDIARWSDLDTGVSLTLAPGSPCMGACLKVVGSF